MASLDMILSNKRITMALIKLHGCAGWSLRLLVAKSQRQVFSQQGNILCHYNYNTMQLILFCHMRPNARKRPFCHRQALTLRLSLHLYIWAMMRENMTLLYANNKGADQPVHSVISIFGFFASCKA